MSAFNPSDEKVIERVRKELRIRRRLGAIFLIVGVLGVAVFAYWDYHMSVRPFRLLEGLPDRATEQQITTAFDRARYGNYFGLGFTAGCGLCSFLPFVVIGSVWLIGRNRKDRLLLRCWDERSVNPGPTA